MCSFQSHHKTKRETERQSRLALLFWYFNVLSTSEQTEAPGQAMQMNILSVTWIYF